MAQGSNQVGLSQPVYLTNADGGATGGSQTSANSQSVTPASDGAPFPVMGNVAHGVTDAGNPVKIGGKAFTGIPTAATNGQRADAWFTPDGKLTVALRFASNSMLYESYDANGLAKIGNSLLAVQARNMVNDGTNWNMMPGDTNRVWSGNPPSAASSALSGTIATSGGTAAITMTNTTRSEVLNPSSATLWASWGSPTVNGAGSFPINAGGFYNPPDRSSGTLTLLSTAASQPYTINRFS